MLFGSKEVYEGLRMNSKVERTVLRIAVCGQVGFMYGLECSLWVQEDCWLYKGREFWVSGKKGASYQPISFCIIFSCCNADRIKPSTL